MSNLNAFLDKQGLTHYDSKLKTVVAGQMTIEGRTIMLKSVSGATLATVTMPQTIYELATAQKDGLMSNEDFAKLQGIAAQATKVENSETNGNIQINDVETPVYVHPTVTAGALGAGFTRSRLMVTGMSRSGRRSSRATLRLLAFQRRTRRMVRPRLMRRV